MEVDSRTLEKEVTKPKASLFVPRGLDFGHLSPEN